MRTKSKKGQCPCCLGPKDATLYEMHTDYGKVYYCAPCCRSTQGFKPRSKVPFDQQMTALARGG